MDLKVKNDPFAYLLLSTLTARTHLGDYGKAKENLERALAIQEDYYKDPHHIQLATTLFSLGRLYENLNDYKKAKESTERALDIKAYCEDSNHFVLAESLDDYRKAQKNIERALTIKEAHNKSYHHIMAITLSNTAVFYWNLGGHAGKKSGVKFMKEAFLIFTHMPTHGIDHPHTQIVKKMLEDMGVGVDEIKEIILADSFDVVTTSSSECHCCIIA